MSLVGTGKTLVARALANECGGNGRRVGFYMRKGADCLSKWVGESERQLRVLFDQVIICVFHCRSVFLDSFPCGNTVNNLIPPGNIRDVELLVRVEYSHSRIRTLVTCQCGLEGRKKGSPCRVVSFLRMSIS